MTTFKRCPALLLLPLLIFYLGIAIVTAPSSKPINDEIDYVGLATNITHGNYAYSGAADAATGAWAREPNLWFGPGLPAMLAPLVAAHVPLALIRLTGPLFLFLAVLLFYRLLRFYAPSRWSVVGAALLGLYYPFYTLLDYVHSEPLAILLVVAAMYYTVRAFRNGRRRDLAFAGCALGYLAMTRVAYGWVLIALLAVAIAAIVIRRRNRWARKTAVLAAVALIFCAPWLIYTYSLSGRVLYWGNSGGMSLYWMASPYSGQTGEWQSASTVFTDPRYQPNRPFFSSIAQLPSLERDAAFQKEALELIRRHPNAYVKHVGENTLRLFLGAPKDFTSLQPRQLVTKGFANLCLLGAVLGAVAVRLRGRLRLPPEAMPLLLIALFGIAAHTLLAGYTRMLMPTIPLLLWFAITSAQALRESRPLERSSELGPLSEPAPQHG